MRGAKARFGGGNLWFETSVCFYVHESTIENRALKELTINMMKKGDNNEIQANSISNKDKFVELAWLSRPALLLHKSLERCQLTHHR